MKNTIKLFTVILLVGLVFANVAYADLVTCGGPTDRGDSAECTIPALIGTIMNIINFLLSWAALIAMLFVVWSGWNMINAAGNDEAISTAKTSLTNAILGFFMIMISFVLLNFVVSIFTGDGSLRAGALIDAFNLLGIKPTQQ